MAAVDHRRSRADVDRDSKRQVLGIHLQGAEAWLLGRQGHGRDDSGGTTGTLLIDLPMPLRQLLEQVVVISETAYFEERPFGQNPPGSRPSPSPAAATASTALHRSRVRALRTQTSR